jgi:hypothetical protein
MSTVFKIILFVLKVIGLFIMACAFYIRYADQNPRIMKTVCPKYVAAKGAVDSLKHGTPIKPGDIGFVELASIYKTQLIAANPNAHMPGQFAVVGMKQNAVGLKLLATVVPSPVEVQVSVPAIDADPRPNIPTFDTQFFENAANELKNSELYGSAFTLFVLGLGIEVFSLIVDMIAHFRKRLTEPSLAVARNSCPPVPR